jgi:hypothetical protein
VKAKGAFSRSGNEHDEEADSEYDDEDNQNEQN